MPASVQPARDYFMELQDRIVATLEQLDGGGRFLRENIPAGNGGLSRPRVLERGERIEKAAVQFTHSIGDKLPPAATERNPLLAGNWFQAAAISLIVFVFVGPLLLVTAMIAKSVRHSVGQSLQRVGATASIYSVADATLLRPLPVEAPDRLVRVAEERDRHNSVGPEGPRIPVERYERLRKALTGRAAGPEMAALLPLIGADRARARLRGETA